MDDMEWYEHHPGPPDAGRRFRRFWQLLRTPSDFWLLTRMAGWAIVLPILKRIVPLKTLAGLLYSSQSGPRDAEQEQKIATIVRWFYVFAFSREKSCLQRSLLLYRFLSLSHSEPELITGLKRDQNSKWKGHAWILVDGKAFGDFESKMEDFRPLLSFEKSGAMRKMSS
jgi:Transglutaminase-like superfamily